MNVQQRFDLDLLRALAVLAVVFYHFKLYFPSGFIGVDIFFVLSGYLMAEAFKEGGSIMDFYERRLRRILPAMLLVLLIFYILSPFIFLPFETKIFSDTVIGTLVFAPNLVFWRENDYFGELAFTPFLHYWSLGVELQYYVVFPFLVLWLRRNILLICAVLLISFISCFWGTDFSKKTAFFMLPTRIWEFLSGYLAWWICTKSSFVPNRRISFCLSIGSFGLLIGACFLHIPTAVYPGAWALIPVVLSFIVIVFGRELGDQVNLYFKYAIGWIAKTSYSVYLLHFPIFFIAVYIPFNHQKELDVWIKLLLVVVTFVLAYLSFRYFEAPFRNRKKVSLKAFKLYMGFIAMLLVGLCLIFNYTKYFVSSYDDVEKPIINAMMDQGPWRCPRLQRIKEFGEISCFLREEPNPDKVFYLVGDSHMDALKEAFVDSVADQAVSIRLNRNRCFLGTYECGFNSIKEQVIKYEVTDVVLHGYSYELFDYNDLGQLIDWLAVQSVRLHVIGPIPVYGEKVPYALYSDHRYGTKLISLVDIEQFRESIPDKYEEFKKAHSNKQGIYFYSPETLLCTPTCLLRNDSVVFYFDSHHLSMSGARQLSPMFKEMVSK